MTHEQIAEADKAIECLKEARKHLDNAMYRMGIVEPDDMDFIRIRSFYFAICKALDLV